MAVRKQRATTSKEIMEKDIDIAIQKAKTRFRDEKKFYILKYTISEDDFYFATGHPDIIKESGKEDYFQKWVFENKKWLCVSNIKDRLIESMAEWDIERIKEELKIYFLKDTDDNIETYYFDDIATEEEHKKGKLFR